MSKTKLKDIAEAAGVSIGTASRALRGKTKGHWASSAKQMERIQEIAREMDYRPNRAAQFMRTKRTHQIALITGDVYNPYTSRTLGIMDEELTKRGYGLLFRLLKGNNSDEVRESLSKMTLDFVDGVISSHPDIDGSDLENTIQHIPVVTFDRSPEFSPAMLNMEGGVLLGLQHLWALGHQRIAIISRGTLDKNKTRRLAAYESFFQSQGVKVPKESVINTDWTYESGEAAVDPFLASGCTACLAGNDLLAVGLCSGLRLRGYDVPRDFSVVSIDDTILTRINRPQLTSIQPPIRELVSLTVQGLLAKIEDAPAPEFRLLMPELAVRESTGPVNGQV